jgi:hypothetical protein
MMRPHQRAIVRFLREAGATEVRLEQRRGERHPKAIGPLGCIGVIGFDTRLARHLEIPITLLAMQSSIYANFWKWSHPMPKVVPNPYKDKGD